MKLWITKVLSKVVRPNGKTVTNPIGEIPKMSKKSLQNNTATFKLKR